MDRRKIRSPWIDASLNSFKAAHPDMALVVHSDEALRAFIADDFDSDVLSAYERGDSASRSCLARYCLLFAQGGLYSDPNIFFVSPVVRSIDAKLHAFHSIDSRAPSVSVSLIAAPAKMILFERCISRFVELAGDRRMDLRTAGPRLFGETIAYSGSAVRPAIGWGDKLRLPSRAGVIRHGYKSADGAFVAVSQRRIGSAKGRVMAGDLPDRSYDDPEDIIALLSMLDGLI